MNHLFSDRVKKIKASEIREILKLTMKPEIISFAGGLPAPELFPIKEMIEVSAKVMMTMGQEALQYSTTEGYNPLRNHIVRQMAQAGVTVEQDDILITNGSQQGLDFTGKIFLNPGDYVLCESPSYLGAINAFRAYECEFEEIPTDDFGMDMKALEHVLETNKRAKFIYVIPDFQNPSGRTWSTERRKQLYDLARRYNVVIVEDNPYGALRFEGEMIPPVKSLDTDGRVVYLGTYSKTFSPGLRIGWVAASPELLSKYIMVKQGADLQSSSISQRELSVFLDSYDFDRHVETIKEVYRRRRDLMIDTMKQCFPKEAKYVVPSGGLFTWVELPERVNTRKLLEKAVERKVAFVPGGSFFPNGGNERCMRLNFSNMNEEKIVEGIKRLGELLKDELAG
ncbi:MAG: PLP-dependent aminotransferase family protein [Bacillota bacterium]|nr:PLP-dependent aminotransferase family protein [Bacillota bacterium]